MTTRWAFDGTAVGRLLIPTLTTLASPIDYIAEWLVNRALAETDGPTGDPGELIAAELVIGESAPITDPPGAAITTQSAAP